MPECGCLRLVEVFVNVGGSKIGPGWVMIVGNGLHPSLHDGAATGLMEELDVLLESSDCGSIVGVDDVGSKCLYLVGGVKGEIPEFSLGVA